MVAAIALAAKPADHGIGDFGGADVGEQWRELSGDFAIACAHIQQTCSALAEQAEEQAATAQAAFTEAKKRAVGLEKLENRHRAEVVAGELGAEQAAIDEIATGAWLRERVAGEGRGEA